VNIVIFTCSLIKSVSVIWFISILPHCSISAFATFQKNKRYDSHQIVDGNRTPTNFETIILIDFNIIRLFDESISQGNIGWKIVLWDCTCTHNGSAAMFAATCHIKTSLNFVLKKQRA
jgi:hypothetical protein